MYVGDTGGAWAMTFESGQAYTSVGQPDRWTAFAKANNWSYYDPTQAFVGDLRSKVDWAGYLRVLDPCVARATCV